MAKIRGAEKGLIVRACATSRSGSCFVLKGAPGEGAARGEEALLRSHPSAVAIVQARIRTMPKSAEGRCRAVLTARKVLIVQTHHSLKS